MSKTEHKKIYKWFKKYININKQAVEVFQTSVNCIYSTINIFTPELFMFAQSNAFGR
jgi:hypothetical protein